MAKIFTDEMKKVLKRDLPSFADKHGIPDALQSGLVGIAATATTGQSIELSEATDNGEKALTLLGPESLADDTTIALMQGETDSLSYKGQAVCLYDFAENGGAISSTAIGPTLPDNATVTRSYYEVLTTFTSATDAAAISISIPTDDAAGIVAATAISTVGS